jgi:HEPN domain-containing protein
MGDEMVNRAGDWLDQAVRDLDHARHSAGGGFHEWACFCAQQAAEKALKALYQHLAAEAWGHSVKQLLEGLPPRVSVAVDLVDYGRLLDRFYIPTRYPNGFDTGKPADYYTADDSRQAISCAAAVLRFCADGISRPA